MIHIIWLCGKLEKREGEHRDGQARQDPLIPAAPEEGELLSFSLACPRHHESWLHRYHLEGSRQEVYNKKVMQPQHSGRRIEIVGRLPSRVKRYVVYEGDIIVGA